MEIMENAFVTPKKNSGKEEEDNDCEEFNVEGNCESWNDPFEEDEVNGHEGVDIDRILHDDEIDGAEIFDAWIW